MPSYAPLHDFNSNAFHKNSIAELAHAYVKA
jgi:hypothetical protein